MSSKKPPGGFNKKFANSSERKPDNEKSKSKKEAYNQKNYKSSPALSASTCGKSPLLQFTAKAADDSKTTHDAKTTDDQKFSKNSKKPDQERGFANYTSSRGNNQDTKNLHAQARSSNPCTKNPVRNEGDRKCRPSAPDIMSPMAMALEHEIQRGVGIKHHVHYEKKNRSYQDHQHNFSQSHAKPMAIQEIQRGVGIKHHSIRSNQDPQHNFSQSRAKPMALEEINRVVSAKHHAEKSNTNIQNNFPQTGTKPKTPQNTTGNCYFSKPFNQNRFSQPQKNFGPRNFQNYGRFQGPKQIIPNQNSPFDFMQKSLNFLSDNLQNSFGVSAENASFSKKNAVPNVRYRKKTSTCNNQNSSQGNVTKDFSNKKKRSRRHANNFRKKEFQTKQPDTSNVAPLLSFQREVEEAVKSFDLMEFSDAEDDWCTVSQSSVDTANLIDFSDDFSDDFVHVPKPSVKIDDLLSISDAFVSQPPLLNSTSEIFSDGDDSDSTEESEQSGLTSEFSVDSSVLDSETKLNCLESNVTMKEAFVSVFWDIENCALPLKKSAVDFASYVRDNFYDGRTEVTFTAACDVSKLNSLLVRDLDEAAITLIHISSLNKNAADKKIMGFLQKFQVQYRKSNSAVVLISSDSDFADILVTMRYQHHIFVNVICKSNTRNALTASANKNVLFEDILNEIPDRDAKNNAQHIIIVKNLPKMKINSIKNILSEKLKSFNHRLKFVEESVAKIIFKDHSVCNKAMNSLKGLYIGGNVLDISYHKEQEQNEILEKKARKKKVLQNEKEKIVSENIGLDSQLCKGETTSKSATLCVCVSIYLGDTGYWKAEFEKMWNMTGFSISWDYNTFGGCFLINFESLKKAQKAKKIIQKTQMNDSSAPKFLKLIRQEEDFGNLKWDIMSNFEQTQKKKVEEYIQIIEKKKIKFLKKHETVMSEILRQASCPVKGATEAVSDKLRECKEQMETFKNFSNVTINSIKGLSNNTENLEEKLQEYLCDFTRECNCLASALPIYSKKENILKKVKEHQVIVIRAETGSGKSTQLAQYMWRERNNYKKGMVICTQPRKVAAISLAKHVSSLIGSSLGDIVGYQVGMVSKMSAKTRILYVTDFTMLKILISEDLNDVSCVIIDEAHERTIYTDILLGMVKQYLPMHPNLKLLITSATIDTSIFRDFFSLTDDAVLHISGRTFPVEDIWLNCDVTPDSDYLNKAIDKVLEILSKDPGDVLSFLTTPLETEKAIETLSEKLKGLSGGKNVKVFCLHGKMNSEEQQKVFEKTPTGMRKVVFATNCAETSITIPGIKYVIDCGLVKESKYDAVRNMNILSIGFVSKSSAEQRRGRAGRTQVGTCYHLYSKKNYDSMESSTIPEILRINLGQALLKLLKMGIQNPVQFDFIQSPPKELLSSAMDQLVFLKAVDEDFALTDLGMKMAVLPLEPRLCHLIFQGFKNNIGYDILVTAALVTMSQNIFFRNSENKKEADAKKRRFCEYENDFISYLEVYKEWVDVPKNLKSQWCVSNCINARSMRTVHDLVNEIILTLQKELNLKIKHKFNAEASYETLTKIIFRSFAQNLSVFSGHPKFGYKSLNVSDQLLIHPSSSLSAFERLTPQYVVYDTILKTSRAFIVNVCPVSRDMILDSDIYIDLDSFDNLIGSEFPVSPLGAKILVAHFIGKKGMKRKDLQSKIKELIRSDYVEIDIDVSKGCVRFFCPDQDIEKIESLVFPIIHDARQSLLNEERDVALSEDREFIAVLTSGGCIKDVVLPGEFRDIKVILKGQEDIRSVCEKLSSCGTITDIREWKNYFKVTFSTPASARNALDMYSNETDFSLRSIHKYAFMNEREYLYKVVMSFFRRPGIGLAYVTVEPKVSVFSLPKYAKYLDLLSVKVHVNKKTQDICISGLPPDADRKKIESLVSGILPADVKIVKVIVPRKKPTESTKEEIALIKKNISELFEEYTFKENIIVDIRRPSAKDVIWNAFVYFRNSLDGETAVNALKNRKNVSNFVGGFDLKPELKTFLCCKAEIFSVVKEEIEGALEFFKKDISPGSLLDIKADPKGTDTVEIKIRSNNVRDITDARRSIHMILRGDELKFPSDFQKAMLFSNAGKEMIRKLSVDFQECYILQNDFSKTISVFGKETFCNLIKMRINQYLSIAENEVFVELSLKTNSGKTGVLKQLFRKYGYDLEKLKEESAVSDIEVNTFKQLVAIRGSSQSIAKCESIIQEIKEILDVASDEMEGEKCPICQDEVSEDKHRLEYCGHAYCIECLLHLFKNSECMPLNCGLCEDPIVLIDIFWAIEGRKQLQGVLFKKFLHYFVESRSDVSFCPSADCPMIFRVTKDVMNIFSCPSCGNNICTRCEDLFHPGMTCSLSKCLKSNVDASLEIWKNEDPNNRKQCPQCSSPIEKNGGCHHMTCWKCKCHMCWKCLKVFPTSSEVYEHLALCSGNSSLI